jgi:hypothetical protein
MLTETDKQTDMTKLQGAFRDCAKSGYKLEYNDRRKKCEIPVYNRFSRLCESRKAVINGNTMTDVRSARFEVLTVELLKIQSSGTASPLMTEASRSFETSGTTHQTTQRHMRDDLTLPRRDI